MACSIYDSYYATRRRRMYGNPIRHVYIADGFQEDCEELIQKCVLTHDRLDYQDFCEIWKKMNMGCLYKDRTSAAEIAELSEEVLHVAKHYLISNTSIYEEAVAGLFLVYSLINLQPYAGFASLRLVPEDLPAIQRLETVARKQRRNDVLYILGSVLIKGPCQFHAAVRERGMEPAIKKYLDGFRTLDSLRGVRCNGVFFRQSEESDIMRELGPIINRYSRAKERVIDSGPMDRSLQYINENFPLDLHLSFKAITIGTDERDSGSEEENVQSETDHQRLVENIKFKAMRNTVNPLRHLTGVADRIPKVQPNTSKYSDVSKKGGIMCDNEKLSESSDTPMKRPPSPKGSKKKKTKINRHEGNINNELKEDYVNITDLRRIYAPPTEDLSETEDDSTDWVTATPSEPELGLLPNIIRTENMGHVFEIEIINQYKDDDDKNDQNGEDNTENNAALMSLPDLMAVDESPIELPDLTTINEPIDHPDLRAIDEPKERQYVTIIGEPIEQPDLMAIGEPISQPNQMDSEESIKQTVQVEQEKEEEDGNAKEENGSSNIELNEDYRNFQGARTRLPRKLKKTHLKSKLKRLGTLTVANLEETE